MIKYIYLLGFFFVVGCSQNNSVDSQTDPKGEELVEEVAQVEMGRITGLTYQAHGCGFSCPMFKLSINEKGEISYQGERFVAITGEKNSQMEAKRWAKLIDLMQNSEVVRNELQVTPGTESCKVPRTDQQKLSVTLATTSGDKNVQYYTGCMEAPAAIKSLFDELYTLLNLDYWIKNQSEY